jgi:hypothetical protein
MTKIPIASSDETEQLTPDPPVMVKHHRPDWENLFEAVDSRLAEFPPGPTQCVYMNPLVTVTCDQPTQEFIKLARKFQGQWCKRYQSVLGRSVMKGVKNWTSSETCTSRQDKFFKRAMCLTGILIISESFIWPNQWPDLRGRRHKS